MAPQPPNKARALILDRLTPILIVLVFGGVVVPSFLYLIEPQMHEYFPGSQFDIHTQADIFKTREAYLNDLRQFDVLYKQEGLGADSKVVTLVPSGAKVDQLFGIFEAAGQTFGASLQVVDIARVLNTKSQNKEGIQDMTLTLKYAGLDYEIFKKLLNYFETSKRLTDVVAFSFDPIGRLASLTVQVYYIQEKKK